MKLRIKGNSIRLRLTQSEVSQLSQGREVSEAVTISPLTGFKYSIQPWALAVIECRWENDRLSVFIPDHEIAAWAGTDRVGIETIIDNHVQKGLHILVEKDFACLQPRPGENESDHFPNPQQSTLKC